MSTMSFVCLCCVICALSEHPTLPLETTNRIEMEIIETVRDLRCERV